MRRPERWLASEGDVQAAALARVPGLGELERFGALIENQALFDEQGRAGSHAERAGAGAPGLRRGVVTNREPCRWTREDQAGERGRASLNWANAAPDGSTVGPPGRAGRELREIR